MPLNAWEIRQEWFYRGGTNLVFVVGKERKKYRKTDLPDFPGALRRVRRPHDGPDELDKYGFIGYIPNTDLMDSGYRLRQMFITKDQLCDGTKWHDASAPTPAPAIPISP